MTIILAILLFCILIFIHEFGHFAAAKLCDIKVNQFAVGMGPVIFKRQKGETEYSLRLLPIGGFCAMEGEDEETEDPRGFNNKPAKSKAIVVAAGPFMNFILALVIMCIIVFTVGTATNSIGNFVDGSLAQEAGLKKGDEIVQIDDTGISEWEDIGTALSDAKSGQTVNITVNREGEKLSFEVPLMEEDGRALIGINPALERNVGSAVVNGFKSTLSLTKQMYVILKQLFTGEVPASELSGPVGIVYVVNQSINEGMMYFFYLLAMLSLNLAVINLLPLPALDGGRLLFIVIRKITGEAVSDELEGKINLIGLVLLFGLMIYVTGNDIIKFVLPALGK